MRYNTKEQLANAKAAIQAAYDINNKIKEPSLDDISLISSFKGFGGIKALLYPLHIEHWISIEGISKADLDLENDIKSFYNFIKDLFKEDYLAIEQSIKESVLTSFYTDRQVVDAIINNYKNSNPHPPTSFLEPSAGNGVYVDAVLNTFPEIQTITAIEKDKLTAYMLQAKYSNNKIVNVLNKGFEEVEFRNNKFDFIASNIPFGEFSVNYNKYPKHVTNRIHNFFFFHANNLLKENGQLSFITSSGVFNSQGNTEFRNTLLNNNFQVSRLITLPNNLFKSSGTEVTAHLVNAVSNSAMSIGEKKLNDEFITTISNEDNIVVNNFIHNYENLSFYKVPVAVSNPYGGFEYAYKVSDIDELVGFISNDNLGFRNVAAVSLTDNEKNNKFEFTECRSEELEDLKNSSELNYLRLRATSEQKKNYQLLGFIIGSYKGKDMVLATMAKSSVISNNKVIPLYILDSYVQNNDLYTPRRAFLTAREFKNEFQLYSSSLSKFSELHNIKVSVKNYSSLTDSIQFKNWFSSTFKQPKLKFFYTEFSKIPYFSHLDNISDVKSSQHFVYNDELWKVNSIVDAHNSSSLLEIEKVELATSQKIIDYLSFQKSYLEYNFAIKTYQTDPSEDNWLAIIQNNEQLNSAYNNFYDTYGAINLNKKDLVKFDSVHLSKILSLELPISVPGVDLFSDSLTYEKSDFFNVEYIQKISKREDISIGAALIKSFGRNNTVDIKDISALSNTEVEEVLEELEDRIIYDPILGDYNLRSVFFTGDIYQKIDTISNLENVVNKDFLLDELHKALPDVISYNAISKQLGSRWIDLKYYSEFVNDYFDSKFHLNFLQETDTLLIEVESRGIKYDIYQCINGRYIYPQDIFYNAFYSTYPLVKYSEGEGEHKVWYTDHKATNHYKKEIEKIRKAFDTYLLSIDSVSKQNLADKYNRLYNSFVEQEVDTALLDLSDMNLASMNIPDVYEHQKQAIWSTVMRSGGVVDHEVGLGKTLSIAGTARTLKKFGVANKPVVLALKANVAEIAKTYENLYPGSKVLFASPSDYMKSNREVFLNRIRNNDWDVVVMSHDQFIKIPQSERVNLRLIQEELSLIEQNLLSAGNTFSKKQLRGLEVRKNNLRTKMLSSQESIANNTDKGVLSFEELGIDHILIDESHQFKNLNFSTRHQRVSGLGQTEGNKKTDNLLTAIRTIQEMYTQGDFGATFFSGTPITNSLTELYLIQKYLIPTELKSRGLLNFDSWAANFCVKTVEFEANMVNDIVSKERFRYFINVPELSMLYKSMTHIASAKTIENFDRPDRNDTLLLTEQTPLQERFYRKLAKFLKDGNQDRLNLEVPLKLDSKNSALSITAMNLALKASLDMRLINSSYADEHNNKINSMVRDVVKNYKEFDEQKNVQCIFSDLGTSKKKLSFEDMDENYNNALFTSIYDDIKYKLIASGIDEKEIAFVQDWDSKKIQLSNKINKGEIRILIGGTQNAGTGLNIQKRLSNIYHFSIPWKPSELEQRDGRAIRKGNWLAKEFKNNSVDIKILATANTLDNYKVELNKNKQRFIEQLRTASSSQIRVMDEGEISEDTGMNLAEMQAQLSGDNTVLTLTKVEKKIKDLEDEKDFIISDRENSKVKLETNKEKIKKLELQAEFYGVDYQVLKELREKEDNKEYVADDKPYVNYLGLKGEKNSDTESIYKYIKSIDKEVQDKHFSETTSIARYGSFELYAVNTFSSVSYRLSRGENYNHYYVANEGNMNFDSKSSVRNYIHFCLNNIEKRYERAIKEIDELNIVNQKLEYSIENKIFTLDQEKTLLELEQDAEELREQIRENSSKEISFEKKNVIVEDKEVSLSVVDSLDKLRVGLLEDLLGVEYKQSAILATDDVKAALSILLENDSIECYFHSNVDDTYHLIQYTIYDADQLYCEFKNLKEKDINEQIELLSTDQSMLKRKI